MKAAAVHHALQSAGYFPRREETLAISGVLAAPKNTGARAMLIEGPPGCGKTYLAECWAKATGATYIYGLLHAWSGEDDLFQGIDVASAVAGDASAVRQPGLLHLAAMAAQDGQAIVCLDEIDKTAERAENLLLDWLQTGRVPIAPGVHITTRLERIIVFVTSNGVRPLGEPLLRRLRRVVMEPHDVETVANLVRAATDVPLGVCRQVVSVCTAAAKAFEGNQALSPQEMARAAAEIYHNAESIEDVRTMIARWALRAKEISQGYSKNKPESSDKNVWTEVCRHRQQEARASLPASEVA